MSAQPRMTPGNAICQYLHDLLSSDQQREAIVQKTEARHDQLIDLGMLDVDLVSMRVEAVNTKAIEEQILRHERQLGMR